MQWLLIPAFMAGMISFLSPCVLPLVPGYISLISGAGLEELKCHDSRLMRVVAVNSVLFILGFTAVFLALGAVATTLGQLVRQHIGILSKVAGGMIMTLGLHQTGILPIRLLYADKRFHGMPTGTIAARAFLVGSAFGFGWTPCVGPLLAAILTFAATESTVAKGVGLLAVYALGLALPFLLTAFTIERFLGFYARFRCHLRKVEISSGVVMTAAGVLIFTGHPIVLNNWLNEVPFFHSLAGEQTATPAIAAARAGLPFLAIPSASSASPARIANEAKVGFRVGERAPDFELRSLDGRSVRLSDLRGKPILLNFWATWCAPCRIEMPWLVEMDQKYRAQGLQVLGVSMDDASATQRVATFAEEQGVKYEVLLGNSATADTYGGVRFMPESFFVDAEGRIAKTITGLTDKKDLEDAVKRLLVNSGAQRVAQAVQP